MASKLGCRGTLRPLLRPRLEAPGLEGLVGDHRHTRVDDLISWRFHKLSNPAGQGIGEALTLSILGLRLIYVATWGVDMVGKRIIAGFFASVAGVGLVGTPGGAYAMDAKMFTLEVTSTGRATFEGECVLSVADGEQRLTIAGETPFRREVRGTKLSCSVTQLTTDSALTVEIRSSTGNVSRSRTQGGGSAVRMTVS